MAASKSSLLIDSPITCMQSTKMTQFAGVLLNCGTYIYIFFFFKKKKTKGVIFLKPFNYKKL